MLEWTFSMTLFVVGWLAIGFISNIVANILDGCVSVKDILDSFIIMFFGPFALFIVLKTLYEDSNIQYIIIWKRKTGGRS